MNIDKAMTLVSMTLGTILLTIFFVEEYSQMGTSQFLDIAMLVIGQFLLTCGIRRIIK